jgi:hypothetical protein
MPSEIREAIADIVSGWAIEHDIDLEQEYGVSAMRQLINEIAAWVEEHIRRKTL